MSVGIGRLGCLLLLAIMPATALAASARADVQGGADAAWRALAGDGTVVIVRHARAPGPGGDPPGFRLDDCTTQRNLSAEGRAQASKLGAALRARGAKIAKVISSPWCRCLETARLMGFEAVERNDALWNLQHAPPDRAEKIAAFRALVRGWRGPGALMLVSHGISTRAAVGAYPQEAGMIVVRPDPAAPEGFRVVGTIPPPE